MKMKMNYLGNTGIRVSQICFGTVTFGHKGGFFELVGGVEQKEADVLVKTALDAGVNFFDTADGYSLGESEIMLGKALGKRRKEAIIATKVRATMGYGPNDVGLSRHHIIEGCNASLKRLGTDYIDLYNMHSFDPNTSMEQTLRALDDLVRQGKVRYIGCSNFAGWQLMKALAISDSRGLERFVSLQALYSLVQRDLENELVPLCIDQNLGIMCWSPLGSGFLTGKFRRGKPRPKNSRLSKPQPWLEMFDEEKALDIVDELDKIAKEHNGTVAQAALNYLLQKPVITSVIVGVKTPKQLADNLKTTDWQMTEKEAARLDKISQPAPVYPYWFLKDAPHDRPLD
jgi:aryl-alcohol dehydrogenase-like predicted oxidoreductase